LSPRRRHLALAGAALSLVLWAAACVPGALPSSGATSAPALADPIATGAEAANAFFAAVQSGDVARVDAILAPEARIARANGTVIGKAEYLKALPVIKSFSISDVAAAQSGDDLVVTYHVTTDQIVDGQQQPTTEAPRLSVFQWLDGQWRLLAHANFNAINK
jgi:hypothetical protein